MSTQHLLDELLALPLPERIALAQALWQSINEGPDTAGAEEERETMAEARQRDADLTSGSVPGRSHEQVMEAARHTLGCD
jgi:putative addiction module component (TIGR02574 family)